MSRVIQNKSSLSLSVQEQNRNSTKEGKLLITDFYNQNAAFLMKENQLSFVSFLENSSVGNIYIAKIKNIVSNIDACFVEIAEKEICFLPMKELSGIVPRNRSFDGRWKEGDELAVQITRDAQKTKQASVTGHIEYTSQYLSFVLGEEGVFYSKKLSLTEKDKIDLIFREHDLLQARSLPYSCIIRTAAKELLQSDISDSVLEQIKEAFQTWNYLLNQIQHQSCFSELYKMKTEYLNKLHKFIQTTEYSEIVTDNESVYKSLQSEIGKLPVSTRFYQDSLLSLQQLYGLQSKLDMALGERIWLKSGAYLIIEPTEALTVIDVNSGKFEAKRSNADDYTLKVNQEAADEIAVQLRLRNLSGIIIVDFINMERAEDRQFLLEYLKQQTSKDIIPTKIVDMTPLGLVEITRKKIEKTLREQVMSAKSKVRK